MVGAGGAGRAASPPAGGCERHPETAWVAAAGRGAVGIPWVETRADARRPAGHRVHPQQRTIPPQLSLLLRSAQRSQEETG